MHISKVLFFFSDYFNHPLRNYKRYPGVVRERNIPFDAYGRETSMDVYYPENHKGSLPVFVNVHGGGFVRGDKRFRSGIARFIAAQGWFVVNINYRLGPRTYFPAPTTDTINALNLVNKMAEQYDLDLSKIVLSGDSAGGYYAAHALSTIYNESLRSRLNVPKYTGAPIRAMLTFCAPFDLLKCFGRKTPFNTSIDVANCVFGTNYKTAEIGADFKYRKDVNVLDFITPDFPETFLVVAEHDALCGGQLEATLEILEKMGIKHEYYLAKEKGDAHCSHLKPYKKGTKLCLEQVIAFLETIKNEEPEQEQEAA